jgi:hypothetical protein
VGVVKSSQERRPSQGRSLRRRTDRIEDAAAWLLTAVGLILVLLGALAGLGVHGDVAERGRAAERELVRVDAVLLADIPLYDPAPGTPVARSARYVDASGREHDVALSVAGHPPAGTSVAAWVDRDGRLAAAPPTRRYAVMLGIAAGVGIVVAGCLALGGTWLGLRRWLLFLNTAAWAREWALVEPKWSGRDR